METLSKAKLKQYAALKQKKNRTDAYLAEGLKIVAEAVHTGQELEAVIGLPDAFDKCALLPLGNYPCYVTDADAFGRLSNLSASEGLAAVVRIRKQPFSVVGPAFVVWRLNDPGNLGGLLRTADWFGFRAIYADADTVEVYNPKVVQSSKGSVFRVPVHYVENMAAFIDEHQARLAAAMFGGAALESFNFGVRDWLLLGSEAAGLPPDLLDFPGLGKVSIRGAGRAESLNVGVAAGILAHTMYRQAKST